MKSIKMCSLLFRPVTDPVLLFSIWLFLLFLFFWPTTTQQEFWSPSQLPANFRDPELCLSSCTHIYSVRILLDHLRPPFSWLPSRSLPCRLSRHHGLINCTPVKYDFVSGVYRLFIVFTTIIIRQLYRFSNEKRK